MKRMDVILALIALFGAIFAVMFFLRASFELDIKRVISEHTGWFRSYVSVAGCAENYSGDFSVGVFDISGGQTFENYKNKEGSLLVFSDNTSRNVYNSLESLMEEQPSDRAQEGDQFYVFHVESKYCLGTTKRNTYVEGVFHKR